MIAGTNIGGIPRVRVVVSRTGVPCASTAWAAVRAADGAAVRAAATRTAVRAATTTTVRSAPATAWRAAREGGG
jgi:hypothetical protein